MHFFSNTFVLGAFALQSVLAWTSPLKGDRQRIRGLAQSVEDFISTETPIALEQLLCNIGPDGCHADGVKAGLVVASPSKEEPPCSYSTRLHYMVKADGKQTTTRGPEIVLWSSRA